MATNQNKHILIVDDDEDIRQIIRVVLDEEGYDVRELDNGHDMTGELAISRPDVILLDVMLGDLDGRDICRELKSAVDTEDIRIIIVSATHGRYSKEDKDCHPDDYLDKPFDLNDLIAKVKYLAAA